MSAVPHHSATFPPSKRAMWYASKATDRPVGAVPANGPTWVPRQVRRPVTNSPSASTCPTVPRRSGKLRWAVAIHCLNPDKAGHLARDGVVVHHVGGEQGIQGIEVARIYRFDDAAVGDFMFLRRHRRSPLNASRTSCGFVRIITWQSAQDDRVVMASNPVCGHTLVQQPCSNPSKSSERWRTTLTQKNAYLQGFCKL